MHIGFVNFVIFVFLWIIAFYFILFYELKRSKIDNKTKRKLKVQFLILHSISGITILSFGIYLFLILKRS